MKKNISQWKLEEMEVTSEDEKASDDEINDAEETLNDARCEIKCQLKSQLC